MLTSYIVDGFADVGTMYGAKLLGAQQYRDFYTLRDRLVLMGGATGVVCGAGLWAFRVQVIGLFLGHRVAPESRAALEHLWPLLSGMQITNSLVFVYDGLLLAAAQFVFVRNVLVVGTLCLFLPALALGYTWAVSTLPADTLGWLGAGDGGRGEVAGRSGGGGAGWILPYTLAVTPWPHGLLPASLFQESAGWDAGNGAGSGSGSGSGSGRGNGGVDGRVLVWVWIAKALLNMWRCATSLVRMHVCLPRAWQAATHPRRVGGGLSGEDEAETER